VNVRRILPSVPQSVPAARRFVLAALDGAGDDVRDAASLMASELATNCVIHGRTDFEISVDVDDDAVRVSFTDFGGGHPQVRRPDPGTPHGRGLHIVEELSDDWSITTSPKDGATTVSFTLSLRASVR
jgi:anti-sigma regulatory factor (Ser/Thr protein kinase)